MVHEPSLSAIELPAMSVNVPDHHTTHFGRIHRTHSGNSPQTPAMCRLIDFDDHVESADLQNGLIVCSRNSDYSVRGICAAFDFRGDSNSIARQQLLHGCTLNHRAVTNVFPCFESSADDLREPEFSGGVMRRSTVLKEVGSALLNHTVLCRISVSRQREFRGVPRLRCLQLLLVTLATLLSQPTHGDQLEELATKAGIRILTKGESSSDLQKKTVASIPLHAMASASRLRAKKIMDDCSQYRRLPSLQYSIDEPMYRYLLQHPDVAVSTWRVMGISRFEMWQTGPLEYEAKAVDGSEGIADILYQDANQMVFVCQGTYHNVLLPKPLEASALIWFRATYTPAADGTHTVSQKADVFVKFPSSAFSAVAKMLTPVTNGMMDRNLFEVSLYSSMMSRAVRDEPEWVVQVADQMEGVLPQRRGELIEVAQRPRKVNKGQNAPAEKVTSVDRSVIMSPQLLFFDPPKDGPVQDSSGPMRETGLPAGNPVPLRTAELSKDVTTPKEQPKSPEK